MNSKAKEIEATYYTHLYLEEVFQLPKQIVSNYKTQQYQRYVIV